MPPSHVVTVYRIKCLRESDNSHPVPAFLDCPAPDVGLEEEDDEEKIFAFQGHLNGTIPVFDLENFMNEESDDIAFVIMRTVLCSEASVVLARAQGTITWEEAVYVKSAILKIALHNTASCYFQPVKDPPEDDGVSGSDSPLDGPAYENNQIFPADLFLYHHRESMEKYVKENFGSQQHISALLHYAAKKYGTDFAEADRLFSTGLVCQTQILKLFKPNSLIIRATYGQPAVFVLQYWPRVRQDGGINLHCWSLQTNGSVFRRRKIVLQIPPLQKPEVAINDLVAYPLKFAETSLVDSIRVRGAKHWSLRMTTQITYKGWNVTKDQFFVSLTGSPSFGGD